MLRCYHVNEQYKILTFIDTNFQKARKALLRDKYNTTYSELKLLVVITIYLSRNVDKLMKVGALISFTIKSVLEKI